MQGLDLSPAANEFIGRHDELKDIATLLADPTCRLLTLLGPGGIGKTRLALQAAEQLASRYADGVFVVGFQPLTSPDDMVSTIWDSVGYEYFHGGDPKTELLNFLRHKSLLLIMDNLEHLLRGVDLLSELLGTAPGLKLLATSRERLKLSEEWNYELGGLPYPADELGYQTTPEQFGAVQLFVQQVHYARRDFRLTDELAGVLRICQLVEGMPLAVEMAAAWARMLHCVEIADEIACDLDILAHAAHNVPTRHQSMHAVLDHSWMMLNAAQREIFARLCVFRGGFSREAAETVTGATLHNLGALFDKCWVRWDAETSRYDIHELLRQYGEDRLRQDENTWTDANDRHCDYFAAFLHEQEGPLHADGYSEAIQGIEADLENVRACWNWAMAQRKAKQLDQALQALWQFYDTGQRFQESERAFARAMAALENERNQPGIALLYSRLQTRHAHMCFCVGEYDQSRAEIEPCIAFLRTVDRHPDLGLALNTMVNIWSAIGRDLDIAIAYLEESVRLYREIDDRYGLAITLPYLADHYKDDLVKYSYDQARACAEEGLRYAIEIGSEPAMAGAYGFLGSINRNAGDLEEGRRNTEQALAINLKLGIVTGVVMVSNWLMWTLFKMADYEAMLRTAHRALAYGTEYRLMEHAVDTVGLVAHCYLALGRVERALELAGLARAYVAYDYLELDEVLAKYGADDQPEHYRGAIERGRTMNPDASLYAVYDEVGRLLEDGSLFDDLPDLLTSRELEVLQLIAEGHTNRQIAAELILSLGTVKWYTSAIYSKLHVKNRTQAVAQARELGLLT